MIEDDETLQMYIEESLEHLSDIESDLLAIEEGGKDIDIDLVNNVFRAAHSIKGGAGFMGLTTIKNLGHSLENVLDLIRNMELVPDSNVISVLLNGFDKLESLMNNIATSNEEDVSEYITALENVAKKTSKSEADQSEADQNLEQEISSETFSIYLEDGRVFPQVSPYDIEQCRNEGKFIFLVEYDLIHDLQNKNKSPLDFLESLKKTGTILDARIDFQTIGTLEKESLPAKIPFQMLYASILEPDMAGTLFDLEEEYIHVISENMIQLSDSPEEREPALMPAKEKTIPANVTPTIESVEKPVEEKAASAPAVDAITKKEETTPVKAVKTTEKESKAATITKPQGSLRINVNLLDTLMNLAGELVLSRNQLMQSISSSNMKATELSSQHIDMITSELQEAIMRTRMQPIAVVLNKFTRVVRDLSKKVGKIIDLEIEGKDVELDKTIIEAINDPLTHLVRNSVDHGIELPEVRKKAGKDPTGKIVLKAFHDAGQVNIVISDDGKGLDPEKIAQAAVKKGLMTEQQVEQLSDKEKTELILLPGFSTAEKVTDISGRGVGMDVVMTNIEKLGGLIEINSTPGKGTDIQIKLPLTLAIIPSQIIALNNEKYAIPQVNLDELLRIPAAQIKDRIEKVGNAEVVRLRGNLLPLLDLAKVLGIDKTFIHPEENKTYPDKRTSIADRRSPHHKISEDGSEIIEEEKQDFEGDRREGDRRYHAASAINIAVVSAGSFKYGLVVDELCDSEEIVVKPLGRHLKQCSGYAGATIMGDGKVALILDVSSLAQMAGLTTMAEVERMAKAVKEAERARERAKDKISLLVFKNGESEYFAAPLNLVERIERIQSSDIEEISDRKVIQYRGGTLPLYELSQVTEISPLPKKEQQEVIVFTVKGRELGLMVTPPVDAVEVALEIDDSTLKMPCISGSMIIDKHTTLLVDIFELVKQLNPEWFEEEKNAVEQMEDDGQKVILFAEDSAFFRNQVKKFMVDEGYQVIVAEDGAIAWELLKERADEIDIIVTDLEMPNMDGFELTEKIKSSPEFSHFSVIALTSLASDAHIAKGKKVGIDSYEIKLDRENLMKVIRQHLSL